MWGKARRVPGGDATSNYFGPGARCRGDAGGGGARTGTGPRSERADAEGDAPGVVGLGHGRERRSGRPTDLDGRSSPPAPAGTHTLAARAVDNHRPGRALAR